MVLAQVNTGGEELIVNSKGESVISYADYAFIFCVIGLSRAHFWLGNMIDHILITEKYNSAETAGSQPE